MYRNREIDDGSSNSVEMQAIQFLSLVLLAIIVSSEANSYGKEHTNVGSGASDFPSQDGGKVGNSNKGKGGNTNNGYKNSISTYCEIQSTNESTLEQVDIGVKAVFDAIRQMLKSSGGNRDKSISQDEYRGRAYNAFKNAIVWVIKLAAKIRSKKSSEFQSNIDAALKHLNELLDSMFSAIKISNGQNKCDLPNEIQQLEDDATDSATAVIKEIYDVISRVAQGDFDLESSTERNSKKSTKYIQRFISHVFLGIRKLSSNLNPDVQYKDCDSCSTTTIEEAQTQATNAMEIQINAKFEVLNAICKGRCSDRSGSNPQQCDARSFG